MIYFLCLRDYAMSALVFGRAKNFFEYEGSEGGEENTVGLAFASLVFLVDKSGSVFCGEAVAERRTGNLLRHPRIKRFDLTEVGHYG